jgi:hypothetical protein
MYYYIDSSEKQTFISLHGMTVTNVVTIKNLHVYPKPGYIFCRTVLLNIQNVSSKVLLPLECYLPLPKRHIKISKYIKQTKNMSVSLRRVICLLIQ